MALVVRPIVVRALSVCALLIGEQCACIPPQGPSETVSNVARDMNVATRFGRMDVAMEHTASAHQREFLEQHASWGRDLRVLDVELAHLALEKSDKADILVDVSWMRMDEGLLRATRLKQHWENPGGGWVMSAEERASGDVGLLGEEVVVLRPEGPRDVHFPSKTIR